MRPVNLLPKDGPRASRVPTRRGALAYVVVGVLALALAALAAVLFQNNTIAEREAEVAQLTQEEAAAQARLAQVQAFSDFASVEQRRALTVTSLAESRFDWERVIQELARITPSDIWIVNLTGSVSPAVQLDDSAGIGIRSQVAGPALEIIGCGSSQDAVAGFIAALGEIGGVTRVSAAKSERPTQQTNGGGGDSAGTNADCRTRDRIARFEVVAAFDAVAVPPVAATPPATPPPAPEAGSSDDPGVPATNPADDPAQAAQAGGGGTG